ncbi:MAG: hypothetical protein ABSA39_08220 [Edaphobacter sp.]
MTSRIFTLGAAILAAAISSSCVLSQSPNDNEATKTPSIPHLSIESLLSSSLANFHATDNESSPEAFVRAVPTRATANDPFHTFSRIGIAAHAGLGGVGFDIATPLARKFNLRSGSDFFGYSTTFQEQGANVAINLHMQSAHASLDWFPFGGRFRLSPRLVFANNNRVQATALIPLGSAIALNGQNYISSIADPLHGSGMVTFHHVSPGLTLGFGNLIPRTRSHFSFPVEAGFYYAGQPGLNVGFSGSACDPTQPPSIGCQSVTQDSSFQQSLAAFIARNNHNLSYASFFPIFSTGFGYVF